MKKRMIALMLAGMLGVSLFCTDNIVAIASESAEVDMEAADTDATGTWKKNSKGWWYQYSDGSYAKDGMVEIDGKRYVFDARGYILNGWYREATGAYYYSTNLGLRTGWILISGKWYYLDAQTGVMKTGWATIDDKRYYFVSSGVMKTGWVAINNKWYYFAASGAMQTGWVKVSGKWYYMNTRNGVMQTGFLPDEGNVYYLSSSGAMQTGWIKLNGNWYYFQNPQGKMETAKWISGKYYVDSKGIMACYCYVYDRLTGNYYWVNKSGAYEARWTTKVKPENYLCMEQSTGEAID